MPAFGISPGVSDLARDTQEPSWLPRFYRGAATTLLLAVISRKRQKSCAQGRTSLRELDCRSACARRDTGNRRKVPDRKSRTILLRACVVQVTVSLRTLAAWAVMTGQDPR
jgi:hypothetical protein